MNNRWLVQIKGDKNNSRFEIAVVRRRNKTGLRKFGWFSDRKLLITQSGTECGWPLHEKVWNKMVTLANEVASELNKEEFNNS